MVRTVKKEDNANEIELNLKDIIISKYYSVMNDILDHKHTHYIFSGGRGSTKSSFVSIMIPLLIIDNPSIHACIFRKVANTIKTSIWSQIIWAIYTLKIDDFFDIPKTYNNPIVYKPTGQKIMFYGLDDPNKVKSIKLPFGYIGITWFEELDQFAGEEELRKVTQSTMRGGELYWDFRSFNPPISRNNWANEYADISGTRRDTLVVHNTYLDVPISWLGGQFIEEAEVTKKLNPRAYQHEYMGIPIGTGGNIFYNVSDFNSNQEIQVGDKVVPLYTTFDNIYNGIDWGFALDPFRFVKMYYDVARRNLYIYREYSSTHERNETTYKAITEERKIYSNEELITADSAEPKSIADFKAYGAFIRGAEKGPDSIRYGIKWLQSLCNIYIDKRECPNTYREFINYEYDIDRQGNFISDYPDHDNHSIDAVRYAMERHYKRKGN